MIMLRETYWGHRQDTFQNVNAKGKRTCSGTGACLFVAVGLGLLRVNHLQRRQIGTSSLTKQRH